MGRLICEVLLLDIAVAVERRDLSVSDMSLR